MALNNKQKNIVNPNPETYADGNQGRKGSDYDYNNARNKWIIEGIHDTYLNFSHFPSVGQKLLPVGPIEDTDASRTISLNDALAYAALYPQNAIVVKSNTIPPIAEINPDRKALSRVSEKKALEILDGLAQRITGISNIATVTTHASQKNINQTTNTSPEAEQSPTDKAAQLPEIKSTISQERKTQIRASFGNASAGTGVADEIIHTVVEGDWLSKLAITYNVPLKKIIEANPQIQNPDLIVVGQEVKIPSQGTTPTVRDTDEPIESATVPKNVKSAHNVFTQAPPENPNPEPYYNLPDKRWYYVRRTNSVNPRSYDMGEFENSAPVQENFRKLVEKGTREILKAAGKLQFVSPEDLLRLQNDYAVPETYYGDPGRPHSGTGRDPTGEAPRPVQKRWIVSVSIDATVIDSIKPNLTNSNNSAGELSSLEIVKIILEQNKTSRNAPFELGKLKSNLKHVVKVLELYAQVLDNEGMTPELMSGLNLEAEAEHVNTLYAVIERWLASNKIVTTPKSTIEFLLDKEFSIQAITVDGTLYPEGYGLKLSEGGEANDIFAGISATTIAYMFYSNDIRKEIGNTNEVKIPWTKFLTTYTYPNPIIYPAAVSQKKEKDKKEGKSKKSDDKKLFKTAAEARRQASKRLNISKKELYNTIRASAGSCGTAQTALLRDALQVYQIFTGKARTRDIIALVVGKIRNELINDYLTQYKLTQLETFLNNPAEALQIVEQEVNKELFCIIDIIGDILETQVLVPAGIPPQVNTLVAQAIVPPRGVKFTQGPTRDFMALWRKKLEQLIFDFVKQLILSVVGDVVKAALGCGPEESDDTASKEYLKGSQIDTYGNIQINLLVDNAGDIDLVRIATDTKLINRYSRMGDQNQKIIVEEPASLDQLRQFNRDVSTILLMTETTALLEGNASARTIGIINEMVNKGHVDLEGLTDDQRTDPLILAERQDSLKRDDIRYASLGITPEKIIQYFTTVGEMISGKENLLPPVDPKEAFCNAKDPDVPAPAMSGLSEAQLQAEIEGQITAKLEQVKSLCELAKTEFSFQFEIDNFIDDLPTAGYYNKFLQFIADASNAATKAIQDALAAQVSTPVPVRLQPDPNQTQLFAAATEFYSTERSSVSVAIGNPEDNFTPGQYGDMSDIATPDIIWTTGNKNLNQMFFRFAENNTVSVSMNIFPQGDDTPWEDAIRKDMFTFKLSKDNTPNVPRLIDGEINPLKQNFSMITQEEYSLMENPLFLEGNIQAPELPVRIEQAPRILVPPELDNFVESGIFSNPVNQIKVIGGDQPDQNGRMVTRTVPYSPNLVTAINRYLREAKTLATQPWLNQESEPRRLRKKFTFLFNNPLEDFRTQISNFWLEPQLRERMLDMSVAIVQPVIKVLDPTCNTDQEQLIAKATISVIQTRVANFMLNVGPLLRVYNGWSDPDTVTMISAYLSYKIEKELRENKLWGPLLTGMEMVDQLMVDRDPPISTSNGQETVAKGQLEDYDKYDTEKEKFTYVVQQVLLGVFRSMKEKGSYSSVTDNIFDLPQGNAWKDWYNEYSDMIWTGFIPTQGNVVRDLNIPHIRSDDQARFNLPTEDFIFRDMSFLKYIPVHLLRGLQIIFYDESINFLRNYAPFNFFAGQREALADDALISALNDQHLSLYSASYIGFPITIDGEVFYGYRDIQNRIRELESEYNEIVKLEEMFGSREPVSRFTPSDLRSGGLSGENLDGIKLTPPFPPINQNTPVDTARARLLTTPYAPLAVAEEGYQSRAYPVLSVTGDFVNTEDDRVRRERGYGFPKIRPAPGVNYWRLVAQRDPEQAPVLNINTKFGLADGLKGQGRSVQKLNWVMASGDGNSWANTFEGMIYKVAWNEWITMPEAQRKAIIKQALTTPYINGEDASIIQTVTDVAQPNGNNNSMGVNYRQDLPFEQRFKPWAALERQRLLYAVEYDILGTVDDQSFLEAFSNYSNWAESNGQVGRSKDYEELHYLNDGDTPLWGDYAVNGRKALFDVDWSTEWFYNFCDPTMADYMIKFYYGDPDVYDPGDEPDELIALRTLQATSGAVLDKVGINHMYLQLAERSIRDKPVFDPDNLNSKLNKLKLFLDNRE